MPKPNDSENAPVDTPELLSTQSILQTLATDPDVGKLREAHPELTDESVRAALRDAATWAASDFVEPTLREKALNALLIPMLAAVVALSYRFMLPLVSQSETGFMEMDLGTLPKLSIWFVECHQHIGWVAMVVVFICAVYLFWASRTRRRLTLFRKTAGLLTGVYAAWVILAVLLPIITISERIR